MGSSQFSKAVTATISRSLIIALLLQLTACGTIIHPERKGQISGRVDPVIAILDGIGVLFFFVPGVIAFAVDFSNGTIYLPHGRHTSLTPAELDSIKQDGKVSVEKLNLLLSDKLGQPVDVQANNIQIKKFTSNTALLSYWSSNDLVLASL